MFQSLQQLRWDRLRVYGANIEFTTHSLPSPELLLALMSLHPSNCGQSGPAI